MNASSRHVYPRLDAGRKQFRDYLNSLPQVSLHRHNRYHQATRKYGDYLWHQDRAKFEWDFEEWQAGK